VTTYSKETAEAILEVGNREAYMEFKPDGVWTTEEQSGYEWTPACELDGPNAPDPLTTPSLPFPFTANELAAFMLDGIGWFTVDALGGWDEGPAPVVMASMGIRGTKAREAVESAYEAYRDAETVVGRFDGKAHAHVQRLDADYEEARLDSLEEHGVGEAGITEAKRDERVKLAYAAIADKLASLTAARKDADAALGAWRKSMVRQLLQPQADLAPMEAMPDPERRLIALRELGGATHWKRGRSGTQAWQINGIKNLVAQEKANRRKRSDEKTIRGDLREAAEAESMAKRAGTKNA